MSISSTLLLARVRAAMEDEYTIEQEIGRGGMAAVFLARDLSLLRRVAIKVMLPDLIDVAGLQDRFVSEARTAARLDHPGIVTVYSVKQRDGLLFIIMKYVEGQTLDEVLQVKGKLEPTLVAAFGARIAEALHFAHAEGIVHRDIKPSNIIIDNRGRPVITDFGIAKVLSARAVTVAGSMLGTPTYMSPEQCRGHPATGASDQYSLGIMMYEMIAGRVPFTGGLYELIHAHCTDPPPSLTALVPGIDPALEDTVMRMLAKEPADRWGTLSAVAKRLTTAPGKLADTLVLPPQPVARPEDETLPIGTMSPSAFRGNEAVATPAPGLGIAPPEPSTAPPRLTARTAVRQRNVGLLIGLAGVVLAGIATVIMLQTRSSANSGDGATGTSPPSAATGPIAPPHVTGATGAVVPTGPTGATGATGAAGRAGASDSGRAGGQRGRGDSAGSRAARLDSATAARCRRLRERWSAGDSLSVAEERMLRGTCAR